MSGLGHVVFFWFQMKTKWNEKKKNYKENEVTKMNKMKTQWKQKQNEQYKKVKKLKQKLKN